MTLFEQAVIFAAEKHAGMKRKLGDTPYILHPLEAALIVSTLTDDEEVLAAAVLHDIVEDTDVTLEELAERFTPRVAALVASETEDKRAGIPKSESWLIRKEASLAALRRADDPAVLFIWLGDKLSNLRSFRRAKLKLGDGMWKLFNQKDPGMHARYYRSILRALSGLKETGAWKEYRDLVEELFGAAQDESPESPGPEDAL